jgi:hypothetical protein
VRNINGQGDDWIAALATLHPLTVLLLLINASKIAMIARDEVKFINDIAALMIPATSDTVMGMVAIVNKQGSLVQPHLNAIY